MNAMLGAKKMLQEIFVALAGWNPSRLERQTKRLRGQFAGLSGSSQESLSSPDFDASRDVVLRLEARRDRKLRDVKRIGLQLRCRWQPAHALGAHIEVDQRAIPGPACASRRENLSIPSVS